MSSKQDTEIWRYMEREAQRHKRKTKQLSAPKLRETVKRKNSRSKGSSAERVLAQGFSKWFGGTWKRTPQSGGWAKGARFGVGADLVCDIPKNGLHVESKRREGWFLEDLVTGNRTTGTRSIKAWWMQATREAGKNTPILCFKKNHHAWLVMIRTDDMERLTTTAVTNYVPPVLTAVLDEHRQEGVNVSIISLANFFKLRPPRPSPNYKNWKWKL